MDETLKKLNLFQEKKTLKSISEKMRDAIFGGGGKSAFIDTLYILFIMSQECLASLDSQNKSMRFHKKAVMKAMYSQMHTTLNNKHVHLKLESSD